MEVRIVGCMDNTMDNTFESANRVYDKEGLCPTIPTGAGGGHTPKVINCVNKEESARQRSMRAKIRASYYKNGERNIEENVMTGQGYEGVVESRYVAMRGRNPDHPTDRTPGLLTEQRLELVKQDGIVNTLTTVQKDNLMLETVCLQKKRSEFGKQIRKKYEAHEVSASRTDIQDVVPRDDGLTNTLTTVQKDNLVLEKKPELQYRIRKLTPRSCWRLMGYKDSDFDKASEVNSSTQLYKQAGNAIVKQVLMAVFLQLGIQGKKRWNEMTVDERQELVDGSLDFVE